MSLRQRKPDWMESGSNLLFGASAVGFCLALTLWCAVFIYPFIAK